MPNQRFSVQRGVGREMMCEFGPYAVHDLMEAFVRGVSPDWSTVRMDVAWQEFTNSWVIRLYGEGIPHAGGEHD